MHHHRIQPRRHRRVALVVLVVLSLSGGATACGDGTDTQGRKEPALEEVEAQVAQLRLEVQTLRKELAALADTVVTTTTTTPAPTTTAP